jgi:hypothetical protein
MLKGVVFILGLILSLPIALATWIFYLLRMVYCQFYKHRFIIGGVASVLLLLIPNPILSTRVFYLVLIGYGFHSLIGGVISTLVGLVMLVFNVLPETGLAVNLFVYGGTSLSCVVINGIFLMQNSVDSRELAKHTPLKNLPHL